MNDLRMNQRVYRLRWLVAAVLVMSCSLTAVPVLAEGVIVYDLPPIQGVERFSAQGSSFSFAGEHGYRKPFSRGMAAVNLTSGKSVRPIYPRGANQATFFDNGRRFFTTVLAYSEGPSIYYVYDFDGNITAEFTTGLYLKPSATGKYFYAAPQFFHGMMPIVYSADFTKLKEFASGNNALITGDSLYLLKDGNSLRLYSLPSFDLLKEYKVKFDWQSTTSAKLRCNKTGTLCSISTRDSLALINTVTGLIRKIPLNPVHLLDDGKVHLSDDGNRVYVVSWAKYATTIRQYTFDGDDFSMTAYDTIWFEDYFSDIVRLRPGTMFETDEGIGIIATISHLIEPGDAWKSYSTLLWERSSVRSDTSRAEFIDGLMWLDNSGSKKTYRHLLPLGEGKVKVTEVTSSGELR